MQNLSDLKENVAPSPSPAIPDLRAWRRDVLSSGLQKSLRRAQLPSALYAAAGLIATDPQQFWRRLVGITIEDFGLSDLELTSHIVNAARNRAWRSSVGGDWPVASHFLSRLALTPADRRIDDVYMLGIAVTKFAGTTEEIERAPAHVRRLIENAAALTKTCERSVPRRSFRAVIPKACDAATLIDTNIASDLAMLCVKARRISQCLLPVLLPSLLQEVERANEQYVLRAQNLPAQPIFGILPVALDGYTSAGREIIATIIKDNKTLATLFARAQGISPAKSAAAILFGIEGGLLRVQLRDKLTVELEKLGQGVWSGLPRSLIPEAQQLMREHLPIIHERREDFISRWARVPTPIQT